MAIDCYIKIAGVQGEAKQKDHKDEIEVLSWSWGVSQATSMGVGGGAGKGKGTPGSLVFTHPYDKASPILAKNCASGKHFENAVLTVCKAGEGQKDFLKVTLKPVFITSVAVSASTGGDLVESVELAYGDIEYEYKPQDEKGGLGGGIKFGWNVSTTEVR